MQIQIPADLQPFIEQEFATGRYASREEILLQALAWLRSEREQAVAGIQQGLDDVAADRTQPFAEALAEIRREFRVTETE